MANDEQLKILKDGVEGWNAWRADNLAVRPDLEGASFHCADLSGVDLSRAYLGHADFTGGHITGANLIAAKALQGFSGANLWRADLTDANLTGANLTDANLTDAKLIGGDLTDSNLYRANLCHADLTGANLVLADLTHADLRGANFNSANLWRANLTRADVAGANLAHARLEETIFSDIDLHSVQGLDTVDHRGPSPISTSTLQLSHGQFPAAFLKGCGLSDWQIENARLFNPDLNQEELTLIQYEVNRLRGEQPINFHRVFISYTRQDEKFVEAIEKQFDEKGVRYWRDVHDLKAGRLEHQIDRAIDLNPLVLLILSERSIKSDWVEWEAKRARKLERECRDKGAPRDVLCPVALDEAWKDCDWPGHLRDQIEDYAVLDFSGWEDEDAMGEASAKLYDGMLLNY